MANNEIQFILYTMPDDEGKVQVVVKDETLWCTQKALAQLFDVDRTVITKHLKNIFDSSELQKDSVCAKIAHTALDGKSYQTIFYNLDAIIAVGYRVSSIKATRFRQWATTILHDYIQKGFAMDDERLKQAKSTFGKEFLTFRRYALLPDKGSISREDADRKAEEEYRLYNPTQRINSDFDQFIKGLVDNE